MFGGNNEEQGKMNDIYILDISTMVTYLLRTFKAIGTETSIKGKILFCGDEEFSKACLKGKIRGLGTSREIYHTFYVTLPQCLVIKTSHMLTLPPKMCGYV